MSGRLSLLRRLTADQATLDAASLQEDADRCAAGRISTATRGEQVLLTGRLRSVAHTPRGSLPTITAELYDGSGCIDLVWLGRRRIAGLEPGRRLFVRGRVGDHDGRVAIYNPWYELRAATD